MSDIDSLEALEELRKWVNRLEAMYHDRNWSTRRQQVWNAIVFHMNQYNAHLDHYHDKIAWPGEPVILDVSQFPNH